MVARPDQLVSSLYEGHNAIVTGATSGIGAATAELLAERGATVTVVGRREAEGEAVAARCRAVGPGASFVAADVADADQVRRAVAHACDGAPLTMAANCAGIDLSAPMAEMERSQFDALFSVNATGMWHCLRAELAAMADGGGSIVNVGSIAAAVPVLGNAAYGATKAAVASFTASAAYEYAAAGIRVNCVAPGTTRSEMLEDWLAQVAESGGGITEEDLERCVALGYLSSPREQAAAIAFLLSEEASFITGTTLTTDGGMTLLTRVVPTADGTAPETPGDVIAAHRPA